MCHIIKTRDNLYLKLFHDSYVGIKNLMITKQCDLYSYYIENYFYNIKEINDENSLLIKVPKTLQEIEFHIDLITKNSEYERLDIVSEIIAGSHISPIGSSEFFIYEEQIRCPIIFYSDKITFFDGNVISVSEFVLPNPKTMAEIFNTFADIKKEIKCYTENTKNETIKEIKAEDYLILYTNFYEKLLKKIRRAK